jgi:hypothetical protein
LYTIRKSKVCLNALFVYILKMIIWNKC